MRNLISGVAVAFQIYDIGKTGFIEHKEVKIKFGDSCFWWPSELVAT